MGDTSRTATGSRESAVRILGKCLQTGLPTTRTSAGSGHRSSRRSRLRPRPRTVWPASTAAVSDGCGDSEGVPIARTETTYGVESLNSLEFESDDVIVVSGPSGALRRWSAATGSDLGSIEPHAGLVTSIALDPAGETLLVGGSEQSHCLSCRKTHPAIRSTRSRRRDRGVGTVVRPCDEHQRRRQAVAVLTGGGVWVWDRASPLVRLGWSAPHHGRRHRAQPEPDGSLLTVPYSIRSGVTEIVVSMWPHSA